jgi:hypothetical protein
VLGQLTILAIIHDAEFLVLSEYYTWPRGLADLGEKVPKPEDVADFMDERLDLLFSVLAKHLRITRCLCWRYAAGAGAARVQYSEVAWFRANQNRYS